MSAQPFDRSLYDAVLHAPIVGNRTATLARVRGGSKRFAVIVEPCIGCDGDPRVEHYDGRWAYKQARAEYDCAVGRST